jgi:hypothetical protein
VRLDLGSTGGVLEQVHPGTAGVAREQFSGGTLELAPHTTAVLTLGD